MNLSVELQEKALQMACQKMGLECHTKQMKNKKDTSTYADAIAAFFYHKNMVVKQSFMQCNNLDMTFYFNSNGEARFSYSGHIGSDSVEDLMKAFYKAETLVRYMDEAVAELTQEKEQDEMEMGG